ncbi:ATP synthase subunit delta [Salegentibacter salinarum]|uniref:ATP synthase subunit delta n=1 Tax=Salegentibacter salinarum TaxID=447422 RepID=A0A2N0U3X9_9FLAO|nr:ATP synthase F1 subunit delta [Salegentibacter salinarum]PKD21712.1 ATP synthase subunit delta [Salegentibacter salinarum]SKB34622.1 F-type H+-transporting ATPase subunit delta [Salegentibacter salinarum]
MKGNRAAQRYAKAILDLAKEKNAAETVFTDMQQISQTIAKSPDLADMLKSPVVNTTVKKASLKEIFKDAGEITQGSFDVLIENGRINILDLVARNYIVRYNTLNKSQEAIVTTAVPLTAELEEKILAKVKELTGTGANIKNVINKDIIGGFILRVGDLQYDASVSRNLNRLKRELTNNSYISSI